MFVVANRYANGGADGRRYLRRLSADVSADRASAVTSRSPPITSRSPADHQRSPRGAGVSNTTGDIGVSVTQRTKRDGTRHSMTTAAVDATTELRPRPCDLPSLESF